MSITGHKLHCGHLFMRQKTLFLLQVYNNQRARSSSTVHSARIASIYFWSCRNNFCDFPKGPNLVFNRSMSAEQLEQCPACQIELPSASLIWLYVVMLTTCPTSLQVSRHIFITEDDCSASKQMPGLQCQIHCGSLPNMNYTSSDICGQ